MTFTEYLKIYGTDEYNLLFYVVCGRSTVIHLPISPTHLVKSSFYNLCEYKNGERKLLLIDVTFSSESLLNLYLLDTLKVFSSYDVSIAWCMFDGAFHSCTECFTEPHREHIYAVYSPLIGINYCNSMEDLTSEKWQRILDQARVEFEQDTVPIG